ncbi:hypothetical protein BVX99_01980, partial [bacterium F16]
RAAASDGGCDANGLERNPGESKRSCVIRRARWSVEGAECDPGLVNRLAGKCLAHKGGRGK